VRREGHVLFEKEVDADGLYLVYDVDQMKDEQRAIIKAALARKRVEVFFK